MINGKFLGASLDNFTVCVKQLRGGVAQEPFIGQTHLFEVPTELDGKKVRYLDVADIVRQSRRHYAERREVVAAKIERWMTKELPATGEREKSRGHVLDEEIRRRAAARPRKKGRPTQGGGFARIGDLIRRH